MGKYERVMKQVDKFTQNPKVEETYSLFTSIIEYLIPRLELFIEKSDEIVDWHDHIVNDGVDVIGTIKHIIKDLEYIKDHSFVYTEKEATECIERAKRAFESLGEIYFYLWW